MRLWKCNVCGKVSLWGPTWTYNSSLLIDDEIPGEKIVVCSSKCMNMADKNLATGEWVMPFVKLRGHKATVRHCGGYKPQPSQKELLEEWNLKYANI